ncbi:MAG: hypothetical protein VB055_02035 [Oscillospiraceae bacterium]|nr:hypothetical protein [Oscillospiraceae bacterium]
MTKPQGNPAAKKPDQCRGYLRAPKTKAFVERSVGVVLTWIAVALSTIARTSKIMSETVSNHFEMNRGVTTAVFSMQLGLLNTNDLSL